jgi:hypothetical protein
MFHFGRFWDRAARFRNDKQRSLNNVLDAPVFGELLDDENRAPSKDPDGFPLDLLSQARMQTVARRQVNVGV